MIRYVIALIMFFFSYNLSYAQAPFNEECYIVWNQLGRHTNYELAKLVKARVDMPIFWFIKEKVEGVIYTDLEMLRHYSWVPGDEATNICKQLSENGKIKVTNTITRYMGRPL
jgi:hypothetical protein